MGYEIEVINNIARPLIENSFEEDETGREAVATASVSSPARCSRLTLVQQHFLYFS